MTDVRPIDTTVVGRDLEVAVDIVSEQVIIAAAVAGWDDGVADKLLHVFGPDHFLAQEHAVIWGVFREMRTRKLAWDPAAARVISGGTFDENLVSLVAQLATASPEVPENLDFHIAQMLWDRTKATAMNGPIAALIDAMKDPRSDPERIYAISRQVTASFKSGERKHLLDPKQLVHSHIAQVRARGDQSRRYVFGIDGLDFFESHEAARLAGVPDPASIAGPDGKVRKMLPGAEPGYITLISTQSGGGKALALDTPIATPSGWTTMGEIQVGDEVFDEEKDICRVLHVSPVMTGHDCYRVDFSDGSSIVADGDHLWFTSDATDRGQHRIGSVRTTLQIAGSLSSHHVVADRRPFEGFVLRSIVAVEKVQSVPVRCIMVDSPSHLYLAGRAMVPTHNTTLATALTLALAKKRRRVLYCAWEPKAGITLESLAVQVLGWSRTRVLQGQLTEAEIVLLESKMLQIGQYVRFMTKEPFYDFGGSKKRRTNEQNLDIFAGYISDSGCDVVVADLWKYCLVSQKPDEEEEALKYQQAMCEDLKFHLFLLQQQTHKRFDMRSDKRPSREGVKGSGTYLEIVDNFLAPNIPSLWKPGIPPDRFEVFVLKQRYGRWPIGVEFKWNADSGAISEGTTIPYDFDMKDREPSTERTTTSFKRPKGAKQDISRIVKDEEFQTVATPPALGKGRRKISNPKDNPKIDPQGEEV